MSLIAGIDYSTRAIDIVLLDENTDHAAWHRFELDTQGDAFDRARWVRDTLPSRGWWKDQGVIAIGIEDPRGYAAGHQYRIQGGILQCLPLDMLVHPWIPSSWRKQTGLPGNAPKPQVAAFSAHLLRGLPRVSEWPQDAHDAHLIARATRSNLERTQAAA